ncbi:uncharacterized protein BO96DRAFT_409971, partial [Aspergillus niger CBS 101883]|uniref:uncharacterized protein n=1 Tax=Aspergillus lacticoffeatus (strain CBS 101883) TaxID=1450533 RepID=UPI000D7F327B
MGKTGDSRLRSAGGEVSTGLNPVAISACLPTKLALLHLLRINSHLLRDKFPSFSTRGLHMVPSSIRDESSANSWEGSMDEDARKTPSSN